MPDRLEILPVTGLPEVRPGDNLAAMLSVAAPWLADGDVLAVTSKVVSKSEGRLVPTPTDPAGREKARQDAVAEEAVRDVARRGRTRIVETRQGFVLAAAGVDASNVHRDEVALLPLDPDASARRLRDGLLITLGVDVAVIVTDTMGRPWRHGLVDVAIGAAGLEVIRDERGAVDPYGNELALTEVAEGDEIAAAAELVKGKLAGVPAAVVRGLAPVDDPRGARPLLRPAELDLFRLGTTEAMRHAVLERRSSRDFTDEPVDDATVRGAVAAALTAPGAAACRFVLVASARPYTIVPCVEGQADRQQLLALGAAVENLLVTLAADGIAGWWEMSGQPAVDLPAGWTPGGVVTIGRPSGGRVEPEACDLAGAVAYR